MSELRKDEVRESEGELRSDGELRESNGGRRLSTADLASAHSRAAEPEGEGRQPTSNPSKMNTDSTPQPLFPQEDTERFRSQWSSIQTGFVDEPRRAVEQGDQLVAEVVQRLSESFASERANMEQHWDRGDQVSTEDLRVALQRYRSFFERLLAA